MRWLSIARDLVLVVDFGAQYAQLIARRVREVNVYSEIIPSTTTVAQIVAMNPKAIILSGGPASVYAPEAPKLDSALFDSGIPIFGICYGFQVMAAALGGEVAKTGKSEYGRTEFKVENSKGLLSGLPTEQQVWMSHGDSVTKSPQGFVTTGSTAQTPIAAFESSDGKLAGVQFHPEVLHSTHGQEILRRWLIDVVGCNPNWTSANIAQEQIALIKTQVGDARAICGLSGGVDSAVSAYLLKQQGYDVSGGFMINYLTDDDSCPTRLDMAIAQEVAEYLDIPFFTFDFIEEYEKKVLQYIFEGYKKGLTPNPDVFCNTWIKFDLFRQEAISYGYDMVATGHYARIEENHGLTLLR